MSWTPYEILDSCTSRLRLDFDPVLARRTLLEAEDEVQGEASSIWAERLAVAGKPFGLRVRKQKGTLDQALELARPASPVILALPAVSGESPKLIFVVGERGRRIEVADPGFERPTRTIKRAALLKDLGLKSVDEVVEYALIQPLNPCDEVRDHHALDAHDHGHGAQGHGHGHGAHHAMTPLKRLFALIRPERGDIRLVVVYALGIGLLSLATPLAIETLVSVVALNQLLQQLIIVAVILLFCLALAAALRTLQTYLVEIIQRRIFVRVASDLAARLPRVKLSAYDSEYGPELVNRFFDVLTVQKVGASLLLDGVTVLVTATVGLLVLGIYNPYLLVLNAVIIGLMVLTIYWLGRGAVSTSIRESIAKYRVAWRLQEIALEPMAYKLDGGAQIALDRTEGLMREYLTHRREHFRILVRQLVFLLGFEALATSLLLGLGGLLVIQEQLSLGQLIAAELIVATVVSSFAKLHKHIEGFYDLMAAMDKLGHLVDLPLERMDGQACPPSHSAGAALSVHDLKYGYQPHHNVLNGLDLDIKPGERVAIIGPSGSGKSTLLELLFALRQPNHGIIELDHVNYRDLRLESLRNQVALVMGIEILNENLVENVRMGRDGISMGDVREALESVGLYHELMKLPEGLHTRLAATGAPLSMGQAKRLMLARAIAGRPRLLMIDEWLDGLDLNTKRRVLRTLFDSQMPWTLLLVTHGQEIAQYCDRAIAVIDGRVEQSVAMSNGHSPNIEEWLKESSTCRFE